MSNRLIDYESRNLLRLVFHRVLVNTDDRLVTALKGLLVLIRRLLNFPLGETLLNRINHSAHRVNSLKVIKRACFHLVRKRLNEIRTTERVDTVSDACLFSDYLLSAQGNQRSSVGR